MYKSLYVESNITKYSTSKQSFVTFYAKGNTKNAARLRRLLKLCKKASGHPLEFPHEYRSVPVSSLLFLQVQIHLARKADNLVF